MTLGTTLFATLASRNFSRLQTEIGTLQARIASEVRDPRPSADPTRAVQLSAAKEMEATLGRYGANAASAADRLAHADVALGEVAARMRELKDVVLQAGNPTLSDEGRAGLRIVAESAREALFALANRKDAMGQGLFAGYAAGPAFVKEGDTVRFAGNDGQPTAQLSETLRVATSLGGAEVFMAVPTETGARSLFDLADDLVASLSVPLAHASPQRSAEDTARLSLAAPPAPATVRFTLTGPAGSAEIEQRLPGSALAAINAASAVTGVTATEEPDGTLVLGAVGRISVSEMSRSDDPRDVLATFTSAEDEGGWIMPARFDAASLTDAFDAAVSHMAEQRARAGALAASVDTQADAIKTRQTRIATAIGGLEDLDVAEAVTRLQQLLLTQEAAQQTYVKIANRSLFDYLR
ncbi:flagellar hook-associated protein FlgL [Cereibacter johrii]|uniref:Flagellar hook-associated protein 3 FlgL n=1 Tax=Cereibacter johrii TaxID=445629 RepID=A0ABX5JE45_9RHOB|nr:flagellar hook-associated protein FlgL [Cereibacter johrii]ODM42092.1 flagellar hook-associated protein 3 [Cereibacter johrii]PTM80322.1 flagellar hook-associated protein 3 FlgL [Cereibacter johrii]